MINLIAWIITIIGVVYAIWCIKELKAENHRLRMSLHASEGRTSTAFQFGTNMEKKLKEEERINSVFSKNLEELTIENTKLKKELAETKKKTTSKLKDADITIQEFKENVERLTKELEEAKKPKTRKRTVKKAVEEVKKEEPVKE